MAAIGHDLCDGSRSTSQDLWPNGRSASPTVMDRVCQQALVQSLEPIFEPTFRDESFGFRPGRSTHMAMRRIWRQLKAGNSWVVDADIADFFGDALALDPGRSRGKK